MNNHYFVLFIRTEFDHFFLSSTPVVKLVDVVVDDYMVLRKRVVIARWQNATVRQFFFIIPDNFSFLLLFPLKSTQGHEQSRCQMCATKSLGCIINPWILAFNTSQLILHLHNWSSFICVRLKLLLCQTPTAFPCHVWFWCFPTSIKQSTPLWEPECHQKSRPTDPSWY